MIKKSKNENQNENQSKKSFFFCWRSARKSSFLLISQNKNSFISCILVLNLGCNTLFQLREVPSKYLYQCAQKITVVRLSLYIPRYYTFIEAKSVFSFLDPCMLLSYLFYCTCLIFSKLPRVMYRGGLKVYILVNWY